ncbi:MAG: diacylglycerol/lipid kinase family protein [Solirubrobacterales bacterium]
MSTAARTEDLERVPATGDGARLVPGGPGKKRMLVIVNPYATTVSDRLKNLVVYALQGRYDVTAVSTEARAHAIEIGREARDGGYDVVVAFGGDGTLNEVANGLAGTHVPVSVLPGGSTNVVCRTLGIPNDVVDAAEHLLGLADDLSPRRVDLGVVNGRRFVFACGAGLDAAVVQRVDSHPRLKARTGEWYFTWGAISAFYRRYLHDPVRLHLKVDGEEAEGITAIAQNSDPYSYFRDRRLRVCAGAAMDNGTLSMAMLKRAAQRDVPTIAARVLSERFSTPDHHQIDHFEGVTTARVESISRDPEGKIRAFPLQVDGDYIGDHTELDLGIEPGALTIIA